MVDPSPSRVHMCTSLLVASLALAACTELANESPEPEDIPTFTLTPELRIDGYEEDLVPVGWLGVASTGRIAMIQGQAHAIRFHDASGELLATVGREGEGPGEFMRPVRAGWISGTDSLWVSDTQLRRAVVISPEMEVVRTVRNHAMARPLPVDSGRIARYVQPSPYAMFGDGSSLVWAIRDVPDSGPELEGSPVLRLSPEGTILDVTGVVTYDEESGVTARLDRGVVSRPVPFAPARAWTISPRGSRMALLSTEMTLPEPTFRVVVTDSTGDTIVDRSYGFDPVPIPSEVMEDAIATRLERLEGAIQSEIEGKLRAAAPEFYAEAQDIVLGSDDRIWIGMRSRPEGTRWLILSGEGEPEGEVVMPPDVELRVAGEEHVWAVQEDELGVESVVRYRVGG